MKSHKSLKTAGVILAASIAITATTLMTAGAINIQKSDMAPTANLSAANPIDCKKPKKKAPGRISTPYSPTW